MPVAFVLINAKVGSENVALKEPKTIEQVKETYMVYGVYDIVARVEAKTMDKLKAIISSKVRKLNKVRSTLRQALDAHVQCLSFSAGSTVQMLNAV